MFVNSLWPSDAIWRHRSGSTLAHVMGCCLTASNMTSEAKARKLDRHSQFRERSSPAVKARAPTSSTTKLWSNHEKKKTVHLS